MLSLIVLTLEKASGGMVPIFNWIVLHARTFFQSMQSHVCLDLQTLHQDRITFTNWWFSTR